MDNDTILKMILWVGIEDYSSLWEISWEIRVLFEELELSFFQKTLLDLLDKGMVEIFLCEEPYGNLTLLSKPEAISAIKEVENWQPIVNGFGYRFSTTKLGEELYNSLSALTHE